MGQTLEMFRCERRSMTLSTAGCTRLYIAASGPKPPDPWLGLAGCRGCAIGARHAGVPHTTVSPLIEALRMLCPRCGRRADRLIWGRLCASCDARQSECYRGKNAKGTVPALSARLHTQRIAVASGSATPRVLTTKGVASIQEAIIHMSKSAAGSASYGRRVLHFVRQYEMAL